MEKITKYCPKFSDGTILRAEKLQQLNDQAFALPNLIYDGYSDGIISGLEVTKANGNLVISSGLVSFKNKVFVIENPLIIPYEATNQMMYLKLGNEGCSNGVAGREDYFFIELSHECATKEQIELCRFKLQKGAKLRTIHNNFEDLNTEFDTLNLIYIPYASKNHSTLHPNILKMYAKELLMLKPQNILDQSFCVQILSSQFSINIDGITSYIEIKTGNQLEQYTNIKIFKELLNILQSEKGEEKPQPKKNLTRRKIMVD